MNMEVYMKNFLFEFSALDYKDVLTELFAQYALSQ